MQDTLPNLSPKRDSRREGEGHNNDAMDAWEKMVLPREKPMGSQFDHQEVASHIREGKERG